MLGLRPTAIRAYRYSVTTHQHYLALSHWTQRSTGTALSLSFALLMSGEDSYTEVVVVGWHLFPRSSQ